MTRPLVITLACVGVALLSGPRLDLHTDVEPGIAEEPARLPRVAQQEQAQVQSVLAALSWRHTGLSERELSEVARAVVRESARHRIDPALVLAVVQVESGGYNFAASEVGALGLMQLMPSTGQQLAREMDLPWWGPETLFDPVVNVTLGVAYLNQLSKRFGSWPTALAAYNWGPARIDRQLRRGIALPSSYVREVMKLYDPNRSRSS